MSSTNRLLRTTLIIAILAIAAFVLLGIGQFAYADPVKGDSEEFGEEYFERVNQAVEICPKIQSCFKDDIRNGAYSDDYCGIYLDECGYLNLLVKDIKLSKCSGIQKEYKEVIVREAQYSYELLVEIHDVLTKQMEDLGINELSLIQKENIVEINVLKEENIIKIKDCLKKNDLLFEEAIKFTNNPPIKASSKQAKGGTKIWYNYGFLWLNECRGYFVRECYRQ